MSRITGSRNAGPDHRVLTVSSKAGAPPSYRRTPCKECPWRVSTTGLFPAEAFLASAKTTVTELSPDDIEAGLRAFACHESGPDRPSTCAGYILRATEAISWRLGVSRRRFRPDKVTASGIELHGSYYDMAVANGVPPDHPAIQRCKSR